MTDYIESGADRREILVTKNIPSIIYVGSDTIYRHVKDFESQIIEKGRCHTYLATAISFLMTLVTADNFVDFLGIPGNTWQAVFIVCFLGAVGFSVCGLWKIFTVKDKLTVETVVKKIAGEQHEDQKNSSAIPLKPF